MVKTILHMFEIRNVLQIRVALKQFFSNPDNDKRRWLRSVSAKFPTTDPSILIDLKNDILKELGIDDLSK